MHTKGIQRASVEKYSQSGVRARMLVLGRTAGLSYSSDPCLLTLTRSAGFSLNDIVLASWYKGSYQYEFGEDSEGKRGNKKTVGKMEKRGMWCRITQWCKQSGQTGWENKESRWAFPYGTFQHKGDRILGLPRGLSWSLLYNPTRKTGFYSWRSSYKDAF